MWRLLTPVACVLALGMVGCGDDPIEVPAGTPVITDVSTQSLVIGQTLEFFGNDFVETNENGVPLTDDPNIKLRFRGSFIATDGSSANVDLHVSPSFSYELGDGGRQILTWRRVGPFANPFTGDSRIGRFEGEVSVIRDETDGLTASGPALPMELDIEPSIIIESFQPIGAECSAPAPRALAGIAYQMEVRVSGIQATKFTYEFSRIAANDGVTRVVHDFGEGNPVATDVYGRDPGEAIIFNQVPSDVQYYITDLHIIASDGKGNSVETAIPLTVHRPIEVRYGGTYELAELYEPEPVSGCIPGTIGGEVSYQETETETRQQSVNVTVANNWRRGSTNTVSEMLRDGVSVGESRSQSLGGSEWEGETTEESIGVNYSRNSANDVSVSTRDGETWGWSVNEGETNEEYSSRMNRIFGEGSWSGTVGASAEGSIPGFAKVTGHTESTVGVKAGGSTAGTTGNRNRVSREAGYSAGGSRDETRGFGTTVGESESRTMNGSYALSSSRERRFNDTEARNSSRTWSFGEGTSASSTISEGMSDSESSTWRTSETLAQTQSLRGRIPRTKVGIFYRQTTRFVRRAEVRTYDLCGLATHAGELQFNEWEWAPELAIGDDCSSEPPPSELPRAQCFISPCDG